MPKTIVLAVLCLVGSAVAAMAQFELTVNSGETELDDRLARSGPLATLAVVTGRLQLRAEMPLAASRAADTEIGVAYNFSPLEHATLFVGIDIAPADSSEFSVRFESEIALERGEISAELIAGAGEERDVELELAGNFDGSPWRGTLTLLRVPGDSELLITPGVARKFGSLWFGMGVVLPTAETRRPRLSFSVAFDF